MLHVNTKKSMTNELADSRLFELELCPRHRLVVNSDNKCGYALAKSLGWQGRLVKIMNDEYIIRVMRMTLWHCVCGSRTRWNIMKSVSLGRE